MEEQSGARVQVWVAGTAHPTSRRIVKTVELTVGPWEGGGAGWHCKWKVGREQKLAGQVTRMGGGWWAQAWDWQGTAVQMAVRSHPSLEAAVEAVERALLGGGTEQSSGTAPLPGGQSERGGTALLGVRFKHDWGVG